MDQVQTGFCCLRNRCLLRVFFRQHIQQQFQFLASAPPRSRHLGVEEGAPSRPADIAESSGEAGRRDGATLSRVGLGLGACATSGWEGSEALMSERGERRSCEQVRTARVGTASFSASRSEGLVEPDDAASLRRAGRRSLFDRHVPASTGSISCIPVFPYRAAVAFVCSSIIVAIRDKAICDASISSWYPNRFQAS